MEGDLVYLIQVDWSGMKDRSSFKVGG